MGKGDQKTRRGKLFRGSYGVRRPRKKSRGFSVLTSTKENISKQPRKDPVKKKTEKSPIEEIPADVTAEKMDVAPGAEVLTEEPAEQTSDDISREAKKDIKEKKEMKSSPVKPANKKKTEDAEASKEKASPGKKTKDINKVD